MADQVDVEGYKDEERGINAVPQNPTTPSSTSSPLYPRIRELVRQNSDKMGHLAEGIVLPASQRRSLKVKNSGGHEGKESLALMAPTGGSTAVILEEDETEEPFKLQCMFPFFIVLVSFVQVVLYFNVPEENLMLWFGYDPHRRHEIWRYFTDMLAHGSASHVWGNVIFQLILGCLLEMVHHWKRISTIYMASVFGGSLFVTVLDPRRYTVGASAGVYGLLFAHLSTIILNWAEMNNKCCRLFWLLLYIGYDVGIAIAEHEKGTSHAGHLGGAVTGFLVAILVLRNFETLPWEKKLQKICAGILLGLFVIIILVNVSFPSYYAQSDFNFDYQGSYVSYVLKIIEEDPSLRIRCEADDECRKLLHGDVSNETIHETS